MKQSANFRKKIFTISPWCFEIPYGFGDRLFLKHCVNGIPSRTTL